MLNLFSFFKQQASEFRRDNKHRTADYLAGGADALREAGDTLTAHKDVVDLDWVTNQLHTQEKEARELRTLNKAFDESRRTFQSRCDLQAKEIARLKEQLAKPQNGAPVKLKIENSSLAGEVGSLRFRIKELELALAQAGVGAPPHILNLQQHILSLRTQLDKEKGVSRVGRHVTSLASVLKALKRVLKHGGNSPELSLDYVRRIIENSEAVLDGREPTDGPLNELQSQAHTTEPTLLLA